MKNKTKDKTKEKNRIWAYFGGFGIVFCEKGNFKKLFSWSSCFCPPPTATFGRAGPAPCTSSTIEPILWAEVRASQPQSCDMGELSQLLICHVMAWAGERCLLLPHSTSSHQRLRQVRELVSPGKVIPSPSPGKTVELALKV